MLFVNTEELLAFGEYLVTTKGELDTLLSELDTNMSSISDGWQDSQGSDFVVKFKAFISEANNISLEIDKLGSYAKDISTDYDQILTESLKKMGD